MEADDSGLEQESGEKRQPATADGDDEFGGFESADPMEQVAQPLPSSLAQSSPWAEFTSTFRGFSDPPLSTTTAGMHSDYSRDQRNPYYQTAGNAGASVTPTSQYDYSGSRNSYSLPRTDYPPARRTEYTPAKNQQFQPSSAVLDLEKDVLESAQALQDLKDDLFSRQRPPPHQPQGKPPPRPPLPASHAADADSYARQLSGGDASDPYGRSMPGGDAGDAYGRSMPGGDAGDAYGRSMPGGDAGDAYGRSMPGGDAGDAYGRSMPGGDAGDAYGRSMPGGDADDAVTERLRCRGDCRAMA
ncbi:PREDICTED: translation initiation factor IF-2-like [Priapulus caudatus]|uniref:Translation initiation factor IF-2-like n=1 Tax=Priapulus caudatus TaxID=37621 RepID=A0ABM1EAK7_PRICU|nr:PREDICTED: translation initiation factor IF-2-like [Priapulus caudatus]